MTDHPITPPDELVRQWATTTGTAYKDLFALCKSVATQAARWGADQELEACCEWLDGVGDLALQLRTARRPKPPSLKEQALAVLEDASNRLDAAHENIIRRALESLPS